MFEYPVPRAQVEVCFDNRRRVIDLVTRLAFNVVSCKSNCYKKRLAANLNLFQPFHVAYQPLCTGLAVLKLNV